MVSGHHSAPAAGPSALTVQNQRTLALLLIAGLLAGTGIGTAFARTQGADFLVLAGAALGIGGALSSLLAGRLALHEVLSSRCVPLGAVLAFAVLCAEAWYASFLMSL